MSELAEIKGKVFEDDLSYSLWDILSEQELKKSEELKGNMGKPFELFLVALEGDKPVGWSFGLQENRSTFYMCNSGVAQESRRQGVYSKLLDETLRITIDMGFQKIYSRHCATNNKIIIPKLKKGFVISQMELSDIFGVLVHLVYFPNKTRQKIMDFRCGEKSPDDQVKEIFKIK